jgi:N-acetylglucosaminyl-diphospho-decaprenol L-rhamnosyltransferase
MDLSVVVVSWNCKEELLDCVGSLVRHPYQGVQEVIVVDNASSDGTVGAVRGRFPQVRLLEAGANLGFARAANRGIAAARGTFLLLLNPDVLVPAGALDAAVRILRERPDAGVLGVGLRNGDGSSQPSCGKFLSLASLLRANVFQVLGDTSPRTARGKGALWTLPAQGEVDWLVGAFMLCRREALAAVGGFDEEYFLYAEDMDLCYRLRQRGYAVLFCPEVTVTHLGNRSGARKWAERREGEVVRSELLFLRKHHGKLAAAGFRFFGGSLFFCKGVGAWLRSRGRKSDRVPAARRYWHMTKVCFGWA